MPTRARARSRVQDLEARVVFAEERGREARTRMGAVDDALRDGAAADKQRRDAQVGARAVPTPSLSQRLCCDQVASPTRTSWSEVQVRTLYLGKYVLSLSMLTRNLAYQHGQTEHTPTKAQGSHQHF